MGKGISTKTHMQTGLKTNSYKKKQDISNKKASGWNLVSFTMLFSIKNHYDESWLQFSRVLQLLCAIMSDQSSPKVGGVGH